VSATQGASGTDKTQDARVLLCFDLSKELKATVLNRFREAQAKSVGVGPFALHNILLEPVTARYDEALWAFRMPIRKIEKVSSPVSVLAYETGEFSRILGARTLQTYSWGSLCASKEI
jgi:hypothetical protein